MAIAQPFNVLPFPQPQPASLPEATLVLLPDEEKGEFGQTELPDGSVVIDLNPKAKRDRSDKFDANLADELEDGELGRISNDLLQGIQSDDQSRQDWLNTHAEGIKLLGLLIDDSTGDVGSASAPLDGMSRIRHPLLLQACLAFQATARGEMLPASGPVKVRDDQPKKPSGPGVPGADVPPGAPPFAAMNGQQPPPMAGAPMPPPGGQPGMPPAPMAGIPPVMPPAMGHNGGPPLEDDRDNLADALGTDMNHFLTVTAKEYVPDTDQMLFKTGFGGLGVKKVYNCPIRRRPVSESVPVEDFIVSNALTDLGNASRITHQIKMRHSVLRRMQLLGVYRDIPLSQPTPGDTNAVDQAKAAVVGVNPQQQDPRDTDYTIYECYCELIIDDPKAPRKFRGKGLALPYRVTIEKDSKQVLEIRRNWREDDDQCMAREYFVEFPFVRTFGFYGTGLLHILGNTTKTLTAAWREFIDSGMFANFPGFIYAKGAGRQNTSDFRVPPGGGIGLDVGLQALNTAVMPLPYKDLGPSFAAFIQHVEQVGQQLGGTAQIQVGEGKQDAPVGTTMALLEQATKPTGAVHKRLHSAQSKEFQLLKERFKDDPEAFWRFNHRPMVPWQKDQFLKALEDFDFIPVSDPNNPTTLHRMAKASWLEMIARTGLLNAAKVFVLIAREYGVSDPESLLAPPQPPQGPPPKPVDPHKAAELQLKAAGQAQDAQSRAQEAQADLVKTQMEMRDRAAERASREQLAETEQETERLRLASTIAIHSDKADAAERALHMNIASDHIKHQSTLAAKQSAGAGEPEGDQ